MAAGSKGQQQELMARPLKATLAALNKHSDGDYAGEGHLVEDDVRPGKVVLASMPDTVQFNAI
jgi:hypothetical protein